MINPSQMLYQMCHDILSASDIKAICKSRGFTDKEAGSRSLFEHMFLSSIGVDAIMATLTAAEIATLHLLRLANRVVDVTFFERLYGGARAGWLEYGTFTQQFKPIFDAVQRNLVRKGLLIIGEAGTSAANKTKMELWRYRFPSEFGPFLPPLVHASLQSEQAAWVQPDRLRAELGRLVQGEPGSPGRGEAIGISAGSLTLGRRPFSVQAVWEWRQSAWDAAILTAHAQQTKGLVQGTTSATMFRGYLLPEQEYHPPTPLPAVLDALAPLGPDEWIVPEQLTILLDIVYARAGHPSPATICEAGWETGCLVRHKSDEGTYYRVAPAASTPADDTPESYLPLAEGRVFVDLERIPYEALELLNRIADLRIDEGRLRVMPSIVKMIDTLDAVRDDAVVRYLNARSADFRAALKRFDAQWGKIILHENLLVARVTDLSLRVKLQQAFEGAGSTPSARPVFLSDEYMAFPRAMVGDIDKVVKRAGHVIKTVQAP